MEEQKSQYQKDRESFFVVLCMVFVAIFFVIGVLLWADSITGSNQKSKEIVELKKQYERLRKVNVPVADVEKKAFEMSKIKQNEYRNLTENNKSLQERYESLQADHQSLKTRYQELQTDYENIQTKYRDINSAYRRYIEYMKKYCWTPKSPSDAGVLAPD